MRPQQPDTASVPQIATGPQVRVKRLLELDDRGHVGPALAAEQPEQGGVADVRGPGDLAGGATSHGGEQVAHERLNGPRRSWRVVSERCVGPGFVRPSADVARRGGVEAASSGHAATVASALACTAAPVPLRTRLRLDGGPFAVQTSPRVERAFDCEVEGVGVTGRASAIERDRSAKVVR